MNIRPVAIALLAVTIATTGCAVKAAKLVFGGDSRELRKRAEGAAPSSPSHPPILVLAMDGVDRAILYDLVRSGEMPALASLLGGADGKLAHAYFDDAMLSTLPSSTMAAWVTTFTGVPPAFHGVTGNEFFIREARRFAAPAPGTFSDSAPVLAIYTDEYLNKLSLAPSVYDRMRIDDPSVLVWVAMQHFYLGADRVLLTKPKVVVNAFEGYVEATMTKLAAQKQSRAVYERLDKEVVDVVVDALDAETLPDVLTVYFSGTDLYAHVANEGPDVARRAYLREVIDPQIARLGEKLRARGALDDRYVVVTSDHGHTEVSHDDAHALSAKGNHAPPTILAKAGFRVRPFKLDVAPSDDFQAVLAYQGAMAYVYLADRSGCAKAKEPCDWTKPPRYDEDVLAVAEAFHENDATGSLVPEMKGTLDMILTRRPRPYFADDLPFEVYVGGGKTVPVEAYLEQHPHPTYIALAARLHDLAAGPHGERAGDVLLLAHNGDTETPDRRFYFATPYHSWHGSPSRKDSEIPFIVARAGTTSAAIRAEVKPVLGESPHQQKVTDVLLMLRKQRRRHAE